MKEYTIEMKVLEKPSIIGIAGFLVDSAYDPSTPESVHHRTAQLYYVGFLDKIEEAVLSYTIVQVVENEIKQFRSNVKELAKELKRIGTKKQVNEILKTIEAFIRQAILKNFN
ncbi:hypothetical protein [Pedobacter sp. L105]|uniref:hypothetical protein n=1 Tax=Pedobacter sp. L105 TaxID=1641871 RepID=UPI00131CA100|nr:hypothetical protein [Pedobacter sp. L105]